MSMVRGKDEMYEIMQRNKKFMPKKSSALVQNDYLRQVLQGTVFVPHQDNVRFKNCPRPPPMTVIVDKLIAAANQ